MRSLPFLLLLIVTALGMSPDACKTIDEVLSKYNYTFDRHTVTTIDGYILSVYHITGKQGLPKPAPGTRPPVILQHGLSTSGEIFLRHGTYSPAMLFYDRGFDVWLPSIRGTHYSSTHLTLDRDSPAYWNYSFEELGKYDTRAFVDLVYTQTGRKVLYLGVSQGFMQMMAGFALEPEFFRLRLAKIAGWAPVVRVDLTTHLAILVAAESGVARLGELLGIRYLFEYSNEDCMSTAKICSYSSLVCKLMYLFSGDFYPFYSSQNGFSQSRERTSFKVLLHFASNIVHRGFYRYPRDGVLEPYNMSNVAGVPVGLFIGQADLLASVANGLWLANVFRGNGNLGCYHEYSYLGHESFIGNDEYHQHVEDTIDFLKKGM